MGNLASYRKFVERAYNQGDLSAADDIISPHYVEHQYPVPAGRGVAIVRKDIADVLGAFERVKLTIEDAVEVGDKVWSRIDCKAIDRRSGKAVNFTVMDICRFENGLMVEHWGAPDRFAVLHQLGLISA